MPTRTVLSDLTRAAAIPATDAVIDGALRLVVALTERTVPGANGASVSLRRRGRLVTVAATDETITRMDHDQYATAQGPCVAAATDGEWYHVTSLATETRWPDFVPRALQHGIGSILSTPLQVADHTVGALNIYSDAEAAFGADDQELAAMFATQASAILTDAGFDTAGEVAQRLDDALGSREVIAQAQGVLMGRTAASAEEASRVLSRTARATGRTLRQTASAVVAAAQYDGVPTRYDGTPRA